MNLLNWIKSIFQEEAPVKSGVSFPNSITKEEYYRRKAEKETQAISATQFWDELNVDFSKNLELFKNNTCPYCGEKLPERKSKTYKCPSCKGKIYRKREILTNSEGLFTEKEAETLNNLLNEYNERKVFLELWRKANEIMPIILDEDKKYNIQSASQQAMMFLHLGKPQFYKKENLTELRNCRMIEGEFQRRFGTPQQATNCYMQILYLDLLDDFEMLFRSICLDECDVFTDMDNNGEFKLTQKKRKEITNIALKEFKNKDICIAPAIYQWAFQEDLTLEKFEQIFKFNAQNLQEQIKPQPIIISDEAWNKILKHKQSLKINPDS